MKPTVGRILWYYPHQDDLPKPRGDSDCPYRAAIVAHVKNDHMVNLMVIDANGFPYSRKCVPVLEEGAGHPTDRSFATWPERAPGAVIKTLPEAMERAAEHGESDLDKIEKAVKDMI